MALARYQFTVIDERGNSVPGAHVEVRREISGQPLAALYSDRAGTSGLGNPFDADNEGFAFFHVNGGAYQIRVYTGASGAPTFEAPLWRYVAIGLNSEGDSAGGRQQRIVVAAGAITADSSDDIIIVKKTVGEDTTISVDWSTRVSPIKPLTIVDGKGDAASHNITIVSTVGQTIYGTVDYHAVIDGNGGSLTLTPLADGTGAF